MGKAKWLLLALVLILIPTMSYAQVYDYLHPRKDSFGYVGTADETYKYGHFEQFIMPEITDPGTPGANIGWLYVADDGGVTKLYFETSAGATALSPAATAWDDIGDPDAAGTIAFTTFQQIITSTNIVSDGINIQGLGDFGDLSVVRIEQKTGNPTDGTVLEVVAADANVDPLVVSASGKANALVVGQNTGVVTIAGVAEATAALVITAGDISITDGDLNVVGGDATFSEDVTIVGVLTVGTIYQSAWASAAAGNVAMTIDAAGNGTITLGTTSTGDIIMTRALQIDGNVTIGDNATDTITVTGTIVSNVAIDDGVTDSPSITFQDQTNETGVIHKADAGDLLVTLAAGRGLRVVTGNLAVGNGVPTVAIDGEDAYVEGTFEVDGAVRLDGLITATAGMTMTGAAINLNVNSNFAVNVGTGTSNVALAIGGGSNTVAINSSDWDITATGIVSGIASIAMDAAAANITLTADGAADDFTIAVAGAFDSSLILSSTGTAADAIQITASAGGVLVSTVLAGVDQFKVSAAGTVVGNAINLVTTNGGIVLTAGGAANGDINLTAGDDITLTPTGDLTLSVGTNLIIGSSGTGSIDTSDWDISTTGVVIGIASLGFDSLSVKKVDTVELSAAQIKDLKDTKVTLIAAPGADYFIEVDSIVFILDAGATPFDPEAADDITVEYETSGIDIVVAETAGWLAAAADAISIVKCATMANTAAASMVNKAVLLFNADGTDIAAGDGTVTVKVTYTIHKALL